MTRGFIRPSILRALVPHANHLKVITELTTMDRTLQRVLEPLAAPPRLRVRQISRLHELGINVQVGVEPLIPGLTDTRHNLTCLLEALAEAGVQQVTAGYLFLRKGIADQVRTALSSEHTASEVFEAYEDGPLLASGHIAPARYLPKKYRQRGYAGLMALAAGLGITVKVSATTNPDFQISRPAVTNSSRASLPLFAEAGLRSNPA
jgi:DNA repair photolyase